MAENTHAGQGRGEGASTRGIAFILVAVFCMSVNDMTIKILSGDYPLHQMVFVRSAIGICFSLAILQAEGGVRQLKTDRPGLHVLRGLLIVIANMAFFAALAALPLATATALFFVAPLLITLLSVPFLGETVGPRRMAAVIVGFLGVLVMQRPWAEPGEVGRLVLVLPLVAALAYASMQVLTRRLRASALASVMAIYIQGMFLIVGALFWLVAGDGRFAEGLESESLIFLLRAWVWPTAEDWPLFLLIGLMSAVIGYSISEAYRSADAAAVAPFEYLALAMAIFWGWAVFGELPGPEVMAGIALVAGAGLYVFLREGRRGAPRRPHPRLRR